MEEVVDHAADEYGTASETLAAFDPVELKIFDADRTILYHSESPELVGETSQSGELGAALDGYVVSGFASSADDGAGSEDGVRQLLEVYVPLQYDGVAEPYGVVELYLPYSPIAAAVRDDVRTMTIALLVGSPSSTSSSSDSSPRRPAPARSRRRLRRPPPTGTGTRPPTTR